MSISFNKSCFILAILLLQACAGGNKPDADSDSSTGNTSLTSEAQEIFDKAITAMDHNEPDIAEPLLKQLTSNSPALAGPWNNLGILLYNKKNYVTAKQYAGKAIELKPYFAEAYNLLGMAEVQLGNIHEANSHYRKAIEFKDNYSTAHYNIALLYDIYLQDIGNAILHYLKYLELIKSEDQRTKEWVEQLIRQQEKAG